MEQPYLTPDPMMEELHEVRRRIQEELEGMDPQARARWYHEQAVKAAEAHG